MTPFFLQKEVFGEKIIIWVKYGNVFTQIMMFSLLKKVDDERTRARGKRNHKFRALVSAYIRMLSLFKIEKMH